MIVKLIVDGGDMKPGPAVAQQIGPLGINMGKVIADVNAATSGFKGTKVPVEVDVDPKTKNYKIKVFSPPTAELIKKELGLDKGSGAAGAYKVGNIAFERIVDIAKTKQSGLLAKDLRNAIKLIVGTCVSLGVLIDNKPAKDIEKDIDSGVYDKEIKQEITQPSAEKIKQLKEFYTAVKEKQDKEQKAIAEAKAAEEAAKAAAATAAPGAPAAGATPAATAAPGAPAAGAKKEEAKPAAKKK
ncbi:50S ribosomal protein L11 [Candidatus Pacearchaeota archaeon]|nr:50S ribosomal protein L11 [Candidatus Pacearchaeota archaeon]